MLTDNFPQKELEVSNRCVCGGGGVCVEGVGCSGRGRCVCGGGGGGVCVEGVGCSGRDHHTSFIGFSETGFPPDNLCQSRWS